MSELETVARQQVDLKLDDTGWIVRDEIEMNLWAGHGVAVREVTVRSGYGYAD